MIRRYLIALLALWASASTITAHGTTIRLEPGEILRVEFTLDRLPESTADTLGFGWGGGGGPSSTTFRLYDGTDLLGQFVAPYAAHPVYFVDPSSVLNEPRAEVDFSSILDGTIRGVLDISIQSYYWEFVFEQDPPVHRSPLIRIATAIDGGGFTNGIFANVLSARIVSVPEPSALALFGLGLVGLGLSRRRKLQ